MQIVGISDVTLGFGSTQIIAFMKYLSDYYQSELTTIVEPDQTDIPVRSELFGRLKIHRVSTRFHIYGRSGRVEYLARATKIIEKLKPDILVIFTTFCIPVLFNISHKPRFVIYYSLESVSAYGELDVQMNRDIGQKVDLIIFPEENRAAKFFELCGLTEIPSCIVYNCTNSIEVKSILPSSLRNGRAIHQGRLKEETGVDFFLDQRIQSFPIDLYGVVDGHNKEVIMENLTLLLGDVHYKGSLDHSALSKIRKHYAYGLVFWKPVDENTFYACPNKFFESIAEGVPPISSPHPQCTQLINRYKCGLTMDDWTFDSFYKKIEEAFELYGSDKYYEMIENCKKAVNQELNWPTQMKKVERYLKKEL
ncbi:MAG: glycosyltransferase [Thermoproteota archaeon]|nr:glycosyltransferase [Thermoproteota archaeon]